MTKRPDDISYHNLSCGIANIGAHCKDTLNELDNCLELAFPSMNYSSLHHEIILICVQKHAKNLKNHLMDVQERLNRMNERKVDISD